MKVIIAGGRDREMTTADFVWLDAQIAPFAAVEVVHGDYGKTDKGAGRWGTFNGLIVTLFPPDTKIYGPWPRCGVMRNQAMIDYVKDGPCALITFPGGRGTADITRRARQAWIWVIPFVAEPHDFSHRLEPLS